MNFYLGKNQTALNRLLKKMKEYSDKEKYEKAAEVKEVIDITRKITGKPIKDRVVDRRDGDPAVLVGSSEKARGELGWTPKFSSLESIVETAWHWHQNHPNGYE